MKRLMLTLVVTVGLAGIAAAQTSGNSRPNTLDASSTGAATSGNGNSTTLKYSNLDQRMIYHWKDGQRATPTGQQATSINGGYASLPASTDNTAEVDKSAATTTKTTTATEPKDNDQ